MTMRRNQPIVIIGCPRSGTTLLSALLDSSFGLAAPAETHFAPHFLRWKHLWGNLERQANRERLIDAIYEFLAIWSARGLRGRTAEAARLYTLCATEAMSDKIATVTRSYADIACGLLDAYAELKGRDGWVEKSAYADPVPTAVLDQCFPSMKAIHLVRDGRDACLSWMGIWSRPASIGVAAHLWAAHVAEKRAWGQQNPDRYLEIRYEDLVAHPEQILEMLAVFLGRPVNADKLNLGESGFVRALSAGDTHQRLGEKIDEASVGKWRTTMRREDIVIFDAIAGQQLAAFGYQPSNTWVTPSAGSLVFPKAFAVFDRNNLQRSIRPLLPLAIRGSQVLGVRLSDIMDSGALAAWRRPRRSV